MTQPLTPQRRSNVIPLRRRTDWKAIVGYVLAALCTGIVILIECEHYHLFE